MSIRDVARRILPARAVSSLGRARKRLRQARISRLPLLDETDFREILVRQLGLAEGDTVYVHSSVDQLNLSFPFYRILPLLQQVVGARGTIIFPTYPNRHFSSYEYLLRGELFDVRRTPAYTGLLNEFARRQRGALRSLHPTKSVCAIGSLAHELTHEHHLSPYPYDACSPYYKLVPSQAKIIGLGVSTQYLSFVYTIDDALKQDAPVQTYAPQLFRARCIDYAGEEVTVETYAHDMSRVVHDIPRYIRRHISGEACTDLRVKGMKFFRAEAPKLFAEMLKLAKAGITVYPRSLYQKKIEPDG